MEPLTAGTVISPEVLPLALGTCRLTQLQALPMTAKQFISEDSSFSQTLKANKSKPKPQNCPLTGPAK
jgi:hypothetical protein